MKKLFFYFATGLTLFISPTFLKAQENEPIINATVSGKVIDSNTGEGLAGATVSILNVTNSTKTNINGEFGLITGQKLPFTVVVSLAGYPDKELQITENYVTITLESNQSKLTEVTVTSRRRKETLQNVPIPVTVLSGKIVEQSGGFNVNRIKELIPSVQLYSSNPRNTTLNIRGLGSTFGLTNDGIDPGVGFYVDGVYYARPAATALDFVDLDQLEVLRGPQGTLFGKNTTAGAFNITTRQASFKTATNFEVSYGNYNFIQAKASLTGGIIKDKLAGRISFSGTNRNGTLFNSFQNLNINTLNNLGVRGQLLYNVSDKLKLTLNGDFNKQRPEGYGLVYAGHVKTLRNNNRQFENIIKDLGYTVPSTNPFDRITDTNTPSKADNDLGGVSLHADWKIGNGTLTSITAWRFWDWGPLNDRDYLALDVFNKSQATSKHDQWTQEIRYSGNLTEKIKTTIGLFGIWQNLKSNPFHIEEAGKDQWRFAQDSFGIVGGVDQNALWQTPGLFEGFGIKSDVRLKSFGAALFGQVDYEVFENLHLIGGLRYNHDEKEVYFNRTTYGGLQTTNTQLLNLKNKVYTNQQFETTAEEGNWSGQLSAQYRFNKNYNVFATYSKSFKPVGVNVGGLPTINGQVATELAKVKPETVNHYEIGVKTKPFKNSIINLTAYKTAIDDYQTQVQSPEPGVNRGYLANAEKVSVWGVELESNIRPTSYLTINTAISYTDGKYDTFTNAPLPLEETGLRVNGIQIAFKDISGGRLPGISNWSGTLGAEFTQKGKFAGWEGKYFIGADAFYRSEFSSSPTPSQFLNIEGYTIINGRIGFNASNGFGISVWSRNLFNTNYFEQLLPAPGNAGHYGAVLGDPQTFGVTLRYSLL